MRRRLAPARHHAHSTRPSHSERAKPVRMRLPSRLLDSVYRSAGIAARIFYLILADTSYRHTTPTRSRSPSRSLGLPFAKPVQMRDLLRSPSLDSHSQHALPTRSHSPSCTIDSPVVMAGADQGAVAVIVIVTWLAQQACVTDVLVFALSLTRLANRCFIVAQECLAFRFARFGLQVSRTLLRGCSI